MPTKDRWTTTVTKKSNKKAAKRFFRKVLKDRVAGFLRRNTCAYPSRRVMASPLEVGCSGGFLSRHHALGCFLAKSVERHDHIQIINRLIRVAWTTKIAGSLQLSHHPLANWRQDRYPHSGPLAISRRWPSKMTSERTTTETKQLLRDLASGNPTEAWDGFLAGYADLIFQVVSVLDRDPDNRSDSFLYVCEQLHKNDFRRLRQFKLDGRASFSTWLRAVVRNLYIDWRRQRFGRTRRLPTLSLDHLSEPGGMTLADQLQEDSADPETLASVGEERTQLEGALDKLEHSEIQILHLRFRDELTLDQLSQVYGLGSLQSARYRLQRVLAKLRDYLA